MATVIRTLDTRGGWITDASFSPDGRAIAFNYASDPAQPGGSVATIPQDGSGQPVALTGPTTDSQPMWSPDGREIVFRRGVGSDDRHEIFVMSADGSNQRPLTPGTSDNESPTWSPDGKSIAFLSNRGETNTATLRILVMDADGDNVRRINPQDDAPAAKSFLGWARR